MPQKTARVVTGSGGTGGAAGQLDALKAAAQQENCGKTGCFEEDKHWSSHGARPWALWDPAALRVPRSRSLLLCSGKELLVSAGMAPTAT